MKTTKLFNSILMPAFAAVLLLAGCEPENFNFSRKVSFTAATKYENLTTATKTAYSGREFTISGQTWERIDWENGDMIRIFSNVARTPSNESSADYKVTGVTTGTGDNEKNSYATVTTVGSSGLQWGSGEHIFFGMYPSPATSGVPSATNFTIADNGLTATISGTIPTVQSVSKGTSTSMRDTVYQPDMRYAYMSAATTASSGGEVNLEFKPLFNAFELTIGNSAAESMVLKSAELVTVPERHRTAVTGTFSAKIGRTNAVGLDDGFPAYEAGVNDRVTVNFGSGVDISRGHCVSFTMLALPMTYRAMRVILKGTSGGNDFTKWLDLKYSSGDYCQFSFARKYHIRIGAPSPEEPWTYVVEPIDNIILYGHVESLNNAFTVKSYRTRGSGSSLETEPVKWKVQYSTSKDGPWSDTQPFVWQTNGAKFSVSTTSGTGSIASPWESNAANILRDHRDDVTPSEKTTEGIDTEQAAIAVLRGRGTLPSTTSDAGDGYFDLSKHPIYPVDAIDGAETTQETANCYVITRPGKYKFPLVYGNAINYNASTATGGNNTMAYAPQGISATNTDGCRYFLRRFVKHDDRPITDPWLHSNGVTVSDAVVVWQDVADESMQILKNSDISIDNTNHYVKFEITSENIRPGNILLAARTSDGTIVWSWHIWVTEKDLSPHSVVDKKSRTHSMMNYNLGWTDKSSAHGLHWNDWHFFVRIVQLDDSGTPLEIGSPMNRNATGAADTLRVSQYGESIHVDSNVGSNVFYQWGRKDPLLGAAGNNTNKHFYSEGYASSITEGGNKVKTTRDDNGTIGKSIKTPYNIFYSRSSETISTSGGSYTKENHMFIGKATNDAGTSKGTAWYGNLWDSGLIAYIGSSGDNALGVNDRLPIKSIYDPSPRGYCVPYVFAYTSFSEGAYNDNTAQYPNPRTGITADGEGWNFNDGNGSRIFLPFAGARGGDGSNPLYDVNATMYYWTTGKLPYDDKWGTMDKSKSMQFYRDGHITTHAEIWAIADQYPEGAYSIRPVLQVTY